MDLVNLYLASQVEEGFMAEQFDIFIKDGGAKGIVFARPLKALKEKRQDERRHSWKAGKR
jgi:hypothetical protein